MTRHCSSLCSSVKTKSLRPRLLPPALGAAGSGVPPALLPPAGRRPSCSPGLEVEVREPGRAGGLAGASRSLEDSSWGWNWSLPELVAGGWAQLSSVSGGRWARARRGTRNPALCDPRKCRAGSTGETMLASAPRTAALPARPRDPCSALLPGGTSHRLSNGSRAPDGALDTAQGAGPSGSLGEDRRTGGQQTVVGKRRTPRETVGGAVPGSGLPSSGERPAAGAAPSCPAPEQPDGHLPGGPERTLLLWVSHGARSPPESLRADAVCRRGSQAGSSPPDGAGSGGGPAGQLAAGAGGFLGGEGRGQGGRHLHALLCDAGKSCASLGLRRGVSRGSGHQGAQWSPGPWLAVCAHDSLASPAETALALWVPGARRGPAWALLPLPRSSGAALGGGGLGGRASCARKAGAAVPTSFLVCGGQLLPAAPPVSPSALKIIHAAVGAPLSGARGARSIRGLR